MSSRERNGFSNRRFKPPLVCNPLRLFTTITKIIMTRQEDIWNCEECNQAYGRHDLWFEGICEKCNTEKNVQLFKVMVSAEGFAETHTEWLTLEEADELRLDLANTFSDNDYWIQHHTDEDLEQRYKQERLYNDRAIDGWEDMFPHDENFM